MTIYYIIFGIFVGFIVFSFLVYQGIATILVSISTKSISEDQKVICKDKIEKGEAPSPYCKVYLKKGKCGKKSCDVIK